jgi:hypothetical protein
MYALNVNSFYVKPEIDLVLCKTFFIKKFLFKDNFLIASVYYINKNISLSKKCTKLFQSSEVFKF